MNSQYTTPDRNSNNNPSPNQNPLNTQIPPKKSGSKAFLIIISLFIILGVGGYLLYKYFLTNSSLTSSTNPTASKSQTTSLNGTTEKLTVDLPDGFISISSEEARKQGLQAANTDPNNSMVFIYDKADNKDSGRMFALVFMGDNKDNNYQKAFDRYKTAFEKINAKSGQTIATLTEVNVNNFKLLKNESDVSGTVHMTEYYIFTNNSVFVINRTYPKNEAPYAEQAFQNLVNSFKVESYTK